MITALQHFRHYLLATKVILRTDHQSLKLLKTFKRPEGIMARWMETLAEFDFEIEHRPGLMHSNSDRLSRPFFKQCVDKPHKSLWSDVDELERAEDCSGPLTLQDRPHLLEIMVSLITLLPEVSDEEMAELQAEDVDLGPVIEWLQDTEPPPPELLKQCSKVTRKIWGLVPMIQLENGVLVRRDSDEGHPDSWCPGASGNGSSS